MLRETKRGRITNCDNAELDIESRICIFLTFHCCFCDLEIALMKYLTFYDLQIISNSYRFRLCLLSKFLKQLAKLLHNHSRK